MKPPAPVIQIFSFSSGQYGSNEYWKQTKKKKQRTDRKGKWRGEKEGGKGRGKKRRKVLCQFVLFSSPLLSLPLRLQTRLFRRFSRLVFVRSLSPHLCKFWHFVFGVSERRHGCYQVGWVRFFFPVGPRCKVFVCFGLSFCWRKLKGVSGISFVSVSRLLVRRCARSSAVFWILSRSAARFFSSLSFSLSFSLSSQQQKAKKRLLDLWSCF